MSKDPSVSGNGPYFDAFRAISGGFGQAGTYLAGPKAERFYRLTITKKSEYDWFAILSRWAPDGGRQVVFGSGHDAVAAILGLSGAVAADRWRDDKFYDPKDGDS